MMREPFAAQPKSRSLCAFQVRDARPSWVMEPRGNEKWANVVTKAVTHSRKEAHRKQDS